MRAVIIGIQGGMGQWLEKHLTGLGYSVNGFDERRGDNPETLSEADLIVVSVPIPATAETIKNTVKHMKQGACLMEIASLKSGIHEALSEASMHGVDVLCVHPMFGPSADTLEGKTVAVVPVVDAEHEKEETTRLFPSASLEIVEADEHDRLMSIILSLPYLINLALAATLQDEDLNRLQRLSGTTFALQYTLIQSIVEEKTSLIHALLENRFLKETSRQFIENIKEWNINNSEFSDRHLHIQASMRKDPTYIKAQKKRQRAYNTVSLVK